MPAGFGSTLFVLWTISSLGYLYFYFYGSTLPKSKKILNEQTIMALLGAVITNIFPALLFVFGANLMFVWSVIAKFGFAILMASRQLPEWKIKRGDDSASAFLWGEFCGLLIAAALLILGEFVKSLGSSSHYNDCGIYGTGC